jgi:5-keto 4-deoxyuronate isomerase
MFAKTYHATHPDMMESVSNDALRDRYLVGGMFVDGAVTLNYSHNERFVIGGAVPGATPIKLPDQTVPASAAGHPFWNGARRASSTSAARARSPSMASVSRWATRNASMCRWAAPR